MATTIRSLARQIGPVLVVVAVAITGCRPVESPQPSTGLFFPRIGLRGPNLTLMARAEGTLTFEDGCLWLSTADTRHLLLWGPTHRALQMNGRLTIIQDSKMVATVGEGITVSGGEMNARTSPQVTAWIRAEVGQDVPPACDDGLYWQLGSLSR